MQAQGMLTVDRSQPVVFRVGWHPDCGNIEISTRDGEGKAEVRNVQINNDSIQAFVDLGGCKAVELTWWADDGFREPPPPKDTCFVTLATGEYRTKAGTDNLVRSARRFHPDVPFFVFGDAEVRQFEEPMGFLHAPICQSLASRHKLVIYVDCDSLITAPLTEVFNGEYDVAGVRNNSDQLTAGRSSLQFLQMPPGIAPLSYVNGGFTSCRNPAFWSEWAELNKQYGYNVNMMEQHTLNILFHSGKYNTLILDPPEAKVYYGLASAYGTKTHWDSWQRIEASDCLRLDGKVIKVLHEADGKHLPKMDGRLFNEATRNWIDNNIMNVPELVFSHGGDLGDTLAALGYIKSQGGGKLCLVPKPGVVRDIYNRERVDKLLRPLLERACPYLSSVEYSETVQGVDLDRWRARMRGRLNLTDFVSSAFGSPHIPRSDPWLYCDDPLPIAPVVCHRSPRYHQSPSLWRNILKKYRPEDRIFVGIPEEHKLFEREFGPIRHYPTANLWELCRVLAGAKVCCHNQSAPYWVTTGLCLPRQKVVLECCGYCDNCHWQRGNHSYCYDANGHLDGGLPDL